VKRARLSTAQLTTSFYGFTELLKLRRRSSRQPGFLGALCIHDRLLSCVSPPMKFVRQLGRPARKPVRMTISRRACPVLPLRWRDAGTRGIAERWRAVCARGTCAHWVISCCQKQLENHFRSHAKRLASP